MDRAEVAAIRLEEHARAARLDAEHRRGTLGRWPSFGEQTSVTLPVAGPEVQRYSARRRVLSTGMAQPAVQQAPAWRQR